MTPALEYLIRHDIVKEWITIPCSLFLVESTTYKKVVLSISEEFKPSDFLSVKKWQIALGTDEQALPFMEECRVYKKELFSHPAVILKNHTLLKYQQESIACHYNSYRQPMSPELYGYFCENATNSLIHTKKRMNWLWEQFISIHAPHLCYTSSYISSVFRSEASFADEQRDLVSKYMKRQWKFWLKWQKHLLLSPGELVFLKDYLNVNN